MAFDRANDSGQASPLQKLYGIISEILFTAAKPFLIRKYDEGNEQRFGYYGAELPMTERSEGIHALRKNALWIHAVSVGEVQSAYPFVKEIKTREPAMPILLSTITKTGRNMSRQLMGDSVDRIYYPWDAPSVINRALDTLMPRAYVTIETEIWPEMLFQLQRRGIPSFLLGGRLSETSFKKYHRFRAFWGRVIGRYTLIMTRSEIERQRFIDLGVPSEKVKVTGDCKVDALIERKKSTDPSTLKPYFSGDTPVILAGSTHEGEDSVVFDAYKVLLKKFPDLRLVLAPRHPERAASLAEQAKKAGFSGVILMSAIDEGIRKAELPAVVRKAVFPAVIGTSRMSEKNYQWKILIVDKIGVLFPIYDHVQAAFIGGSLVKKGGQNIMEPAIWGIPFCQGPNFSDFAEATKSLTEIGVCRIVHTGAEMAQFFEEKLITPNTKDRIPCGHRSAVYHACMNFFATHGGASARSWQLIKECLDKNEKK